VSKKRDQRKYYQEHKEHILKTCAEYRKNNPEQRKETVGNYNKKYGLNSRLKARNLTHEDYLQLFIDQDSRCAICLQPFESSKTTHLDHDHKTNKVRGLLCSKCNHGLGNFKDNPDFLDRARLYLLTHLSA